MKTRRSADKRQKLLTIGSAHNVPNETGRTARGLPVSQLSAEELHPVALSEVSPALRWITTKRTVWPHQRHREDLCYWHCKIQGSLQIPQVSFCRLADVQSTTLQVFYFSFFNGRAVDLVDRSFGAQRPSTYINLQMLSVVLDFFCTKVWTQSLNKRSVWQCSSLSEKSVESV